MLTIFPSQQKNHSNRNQVLQVRFPSYKNYLKNEKSPKQELPTDFKSYKNFKTS